MAVKIRLRRMGQKKAPFYRVIVADSRSPRDGRFIEEIGYYDSTKDPSVIKIDEEKAKKWLSQGAKPTAVSYTHLDVYKRQVPPPFLVIIYILRVPYGSHHLMSVVIGEGKTGAVVGKLIVGLHCILQAAGFPDNGQCAVCLLYTSWKPCRGTARSSGNLYGNWRQGPIDRGDRARGEGVRHDSGSDSKTQ